MSRPSAFLWLAPLTVGVAVSLPSFGRGQETFETAFVRGDDNQDGEKDIADPIQMLLCIFVGTDCSRCADATDVNDDGLRDASDPIHALSFLFLGGPQSPPPAESCGVDSTVDELDCQSFAPCASEDAIVTSRGLLEVVPIEHGSLVLRWDGKTIYADPVGGARLYAGLPAADIVVVTHTHRDHMNLDTLQSVVTANTALVIPQSVADALAGSRLLAILEERVLANGDEVEIGDAIQIEAVPMYNLTQDRLGYHQEGIGNGYVIDLDGTRVYVAGDTEDTPEMRALPDIDLAFICMNLPFTMTPRQAASAVLEFQPTVVYPYHYRGEDPEEFRSLVEAESDAIDVRVRDWYP